MAIQGSVFRRKAIILLGFPHPRRGPHLRVRGSFAFLRGGEGPTRNQRPEITTHEPATGTLTTDRPGIS